MAPLPIGNTVREVLEAQPLPTSHTIMAAAIRTQPEKTGTENIEYSNDEATAVTEDRLDPHIYDDHGNPHQAALENVDNAKVTKSTWAAVFFLGFTFQPSLSFTILCVFPILVPIALELQGSTMNVNWMASG